MVSEGGREGGTPAAHSYDHKRVGRYSDVSNWTK